ncbi:hypothetical protein QQX98_000148 [Neonectria punicea]|uniref:Uncharacterized protein n=1 Tax=Neonectria punicea TaxID=979145 RepID=A0ABR1HUF6_9HYPO
MPSPEGGAGPRRDKPSLKNIICQVSETNARVEGFMQFPDFSRPGSAVGKESSGKEHDVPPLSRTAAYSSLRALHVPPPPSPPLLQESTQSPLRKRVPPGTRSLFHSQVHPSGSPANSPRTPNPAGNAPHAEPRIPRQPPRTGVHVFCKHSLQDDCRCHRPLRPGDEGDYCQECWEGRCGGSPPKGSEPTSQPKTQAGKSTTHVRFRDD